MSGAIKLRDYQEVAVNEVRAQFKAKILAVLFVLPTGGGKTFTFSYIADSAAKLGRSVCIIVHRKELLLQASASLRALGIEHGLISPDFTPNPRALVQVASVDTLLLRMKKREYKFGLLIYDEAHHVIAGNKWGRLYEMLNKPPMLGVTATPVRTDGKGLGEEAGGVFKAMVLGPSVVELIARGMLINPHVYASPFVPDVDDIKTDRNGSDNLMALAKRVDKPKITGSAVAHYTELCAGRRAIVFCSGIEHAKHVRDEFNAAGYRFELLVGAPHMSDAERTAVNLRLRRGEIHGACTVDLVSEGYDLPDLEVCIMLRPTASEALFLQQVGRVMRPSPGKTECWLLDHVGNVGKLQEDGSFKRKHGLPNEDREWTLLGRKKKKRGVTEEEDDDVKVDIKQCPKCFTTHETSPACPKCGHVYPVTAARSLAQVDGKLTKITEEMQQAEDRKRQASAQAAARTVEQMVKDLGYSEKRAEAIVKHREEKTELRQSIIRDMQEWQKKTGQNASQVLGIYLSDLKMMKPKGLKAMREKLDQHRLEHMGARPGDDIQFAEFAQQTLLPGGNASTNGGEPAF